MRQLRHVAAALAVLACSEVTSSGNGVIAIQLLVPAGAAVEPGDTLTLVAQALDKNGDVVNEPVYWRTPDPNLLTMVDSIGLLTTDSLTGTGEVQAYVGSLLSSLVSITVHPPSDTLAIVGPDTMTVPDADTASAPLDAAVQTLNPPGGVPSTAISYVVFDSLASLGLVHFQGGGLSLRAQTGTDGSPTTDVTLRRTTGEVQPDSVIVEVFAYRPSQAVVPGSGQRFIVRFQ
ncbi:MAG TPA: hypothetical protein VLB12_14705 [Gemmatimonadales bacterium]|nr:hypothetical protein [Gemmatimonadales bacterium]